jgi:hypothetical protein
MENTLDFDSMKLFLNASVILLEIIIASFILFSDSCSKKEVETAKTDTWDIDANGIPKFVYFNYIEIGKIYRISRFRSTVGHDYSDAFEHCRSMKHYFEPKEGIDWANVKIYSPINGTITRLEEEWAGTKLEIETDSLPAFRISIFHINLAISLQLGQKVTVGEYLGNHIGSQTMSDISVIVNDPTRQGRMVSYFDIITDNLFKEYSVHGVSDRTQFIISRQERDNYPLTCNGDTFIGNDTLQQWVVLNK